MADIVIPHTFSPNTLIESAKVNANFTQLSTNAFNKVDGDTCEGPAVFEGAVTVEGTLTLTGSVSGLAVAGTDLTGTTLASNVVTSSLTSVGTVTSGTWSGSFGAVSGANLTGLNADNLATGTVPINRLSGLTPANFTSTGVSQWANDAGYLTAGSTGGVPPGVITMYGGSSAPADWLLCRGQAVNRTTYDALFAVVGTTYGVGDGVTTFNLPNLQQRFPLGYTTGGGTGGTLGETGGLVNHTHTGPSHTHAVDPASTSTSSGGGHGHSLSGSSASGGTHTHTFSASTSYVEVNHSHYFSTTTEGDHSHTLGGVGITSGGDDTVGTTSTNTTGDHSHTGTTAGTVASTSHRHDLSGTTDSDGGHTHGAGTLAVVSASDHTHTVDIASTTSGSGGTGNTGSADPPYLTLNFIIKT